MTERDERNSGYRRDAQMKALRFEQFVTDLVSRRFSWDIEVEKRLGHGGVADVVATDEVGVKYLIEIKYASPQTERRIRDAVEKLTRLRARFALEASAVVKPVLAVGAVVSQRYRSWIEEMDIVVWDANTLADWAADDPSVVADALDLLAVEAVRRIPAPHSQLDISAIACGKENWQHYQRTVLELFDYLFCPPLNTPFEEHSNDAGLKRRDIIMPNYAEGGFWRYLAQRYTADHIVVDAKNYCDPVGKTQVLQMAHYLSEGGVGLFGLVVTRKGVDGAGYYTAREEWILNRKLIILLTDSDLLQMIETKASGGMPEEVIRQRIEDFRLKI